MLARLLLEVVHELLEPPASELEELAALSPHDDEQSTLAAADERHERREIELPPHLGVIGYRFGQGQRAPDVVEAVGEDGEAVRPLSRELAVEEITNPLEVGLQSLALIVIQVAAIGAISFGRLVEERVQPRRRIAARRCDTWIEVEVETDGAAFFRLEAGKITELVPGDRSRQESPEVLSERHATYTNRNTRLVDFVYY
jgi:hypothetical protein